MPITSFWFIQKVVFVNHLHAKNFSGMCGIQWTEATVTGNQNAFDLNAANNPELAQVSYKYMTLYFYRTI